MKARQDTSEDTCDGCLVLPRTRSRVKTHRTLSRAFRPRACVPMLARLLPNVCGVRRSGDGEDGRDRDDIARSTSGGTI